MIRSIKLSTLVTAIFLIAAIGLGGCFHPSEAVIKLDPTERHQIISGWEVTAEMADKPVPGARTAFWNEIYDRAVGEVGINRIRLEVRSGAESASRNWDRYVSGDVPYAYWRGVRYATVNDNANPNVIDWNGFDFSELDWRLEVGVLPIRNRLLARGEKLFVNLCYVAFTGQIKYGHYLHENPHEYAEFVLATYLHMQQKYGFVPDAWEVILEPDLRGGVWDGNEIGRAIVAAAARLKEHGFTPRFIAPSVTDMGNAARYIDAIAAVEGAMAHVIELSYHRYSGATAENLAEIVDRAKRHYVGTSMLEWWFGRAGPETLHLDLKQGHNSAWQGRVLKTLFRKIDERNPENAVVALQTDTRQNLQYFRYIRAGARRISAASSNERDFDPVAFINPNGSHTVVVLARNAGTITISGLPAGDYRVSYALDDKSGRAPGPIHLKPGASVRTEIPGAGVVTVFAADTFER
jgi:O-glycosyl hydrolase